MKTTIAYLLFFAFSVQLMGNLITLSAYEINKDYISKNLCVNRNKPNSHCNGKCHLKKELQKEESKSDTPGNSLKDKNETIQFIEPKFEDLFSTNSCDVKIDFFYFDSKSINIRSSIFHPPLV